MKLLKFTSSRDGFVYLNPSKITAVVTNADGCIHIFTSDDNRAVPWSIAEELTHVLRKIETGFDGRLDGDE